MAMSPQTMKKKRLSTADVLRYRPQKVSRSTVRKVYAKWRQKQDIQARCDIPTCQFHAGDLLWLGKRLPLILDHVNGNKLDNSPENLRYLCPNCDSQLSTRGGANCGRVLEAAEGRYVLLDRDGKQHFHLIAEAGTLQLQGHAPTVIETNKSPSE